MPFITFIYKIGKNSINSKIYYGKYVVDHMGISDDHEGLDNEIYPYLLNGINIYRLQKNLPKLTKKINIGILSFSIDNFIPTFSSNSEIECFNFYYEKYYNKKAKTYINGKLLE